MATHEEVLELISNYKFKSNANKDSINILMNEEINKFERQVGMDIYKEIPYIKVYFNALTRALNFHVIKKKDYVSLMNEINELMGSKFKVKIEKNNIRILQ